MIVVSIALLLVILVSGAIIFVWTCYALFCIRHDTFDGKTMSKERRRTKRIVGERLQNRVNIYKSYCDHLAMQGSVPPVYPMLTETLIRCKQIPQAVEISPCEQSVPSLKRVEENEQDSTYSESSEVSSHSDEGIVFVGDHNM